MIYLLPPALHRVLAEIVLCGGLVMLVVFTRVPVLRERLADFALLVFAAAAVGAVAEMDAEPGWILRGMLVVDPFGTFFKFVLAMCAMGEIWLLSRSRAEPPGVADWSPAALAASLVGMFVMVTATSVVAAW